MVFLYCIEFPTTDILNYVPLAKLPRTLQRYHPAGSVMLGCRHSVMGVPVPEAFVHNNKVYIRFFYDIEDITYNKDDENSINACMGLHKYGIVNDITFTLPDGRVVDVVGIKKRPLEDMDDAYLDHLEETGELYKD